MFSVKQENKKWVVEGFPKKVVYNSAKSVPPSLVDKLIAGLNGRIPTSEEVKFFQERGIKMN